MRIDLPKSGKVGKPCIGHEMLGKIKLCNLPFKFIHISSAINTSPSPKVVVVDAIRIFDSVSNVPLQSHCNVWALAKTGQPLDVRRHSAAPFPYTLLWELPCLGKLCHADSCNNVGDDYSLKGERPQHALH